MGRRDLEHLGVLLKECSRRGALVTRCLPPVASNLGTSYEKCFWRSEKRYCRDLLAGWKSE